MDNTPAVENMNNRNSEIEDKFDNCTDHKVCVYETVISGGYIKQEPSGSEHEPGNIHNYVDIKDEIIQDPTIVVQETGLTTNIKGNYLTCCECGEEYELYCLKCPMLIRIFDSNNPDLSDNRDMRTLPKNFVDICETQSDLGIVALKIIPKGVAFGPFRGLDSIKDGAESKWILTNKELVSTKDPKRLNWMQYIRRVDQSSHPNLTSFQHADGLYYRSVCQISIADELLVCLDSNRDESTAQDSFLRPQICESFDNVYACTLCCVGYKAICHLAVHNSRCPAKRDQNDFCKGIIQCEFCKIYLDKKEYSDYHMDQCCKSEENIVISDDSSPEQRRHRRRRRCHRFERRRRATNFLISFPVPDGYDDDTFDVRTEFLDIFSDFVLRMYCVALQKPGTFVRAFIAFEEGWIPSDLRIFVHYSIPKDARTRMDLRTARNTRDALISVSSWDRHPIFNCREEELSFNYRAYLWAVRTPTFRYSDPFVVNHRQRAGYLRRLLTDVRSDPSVVAPYRLQPCRFTYTCPWTIECARWFNSRLTSVGNRNTRHQQLYLYGRIGVGKSTFLESLVGRDDWPRVYLPTAGRLAFADLDTGYHRIVIFEGFAQHDYPLRVLWRLLEGRSLRTRIGGGSSSVTFDGPVVIVSHEMTISDPLLLARLRIVHASEPYWTYPRGPVPKEEGDDDDVETVTEDVEPADDGTSAPDLAVPGPSSHPS